MDLKVSQADIRHVKKRRKKEQSFFFFTNYIATVSFAGLGYLSFYMAGKLRLFDEKGVSDIVSLM